MLLQMRTFTRSWISYLLLFILSAMFVVFLGNGQSILDAFQQSSSTQVASGGGVSVDLREVERDFATELRLAQRQQPNADREMAIEGGLHQQVLERLIRRKALFSYVARIGAVIGDTDLDQRITTGPEGQNPVTGAYDPNTLNRNLSDNGYNYEEFRNDLRGELSATMFMQAAAEGVRPPSSFGALQVAFESETRVISIAEAGLSAIATVPAPSEQHVQQFWQDNQERLRVPEFRALSLVLARPEDFAARVTIPEERLSAEIEARRAEAALPERRTYSRVSAPTEALARQAADRMARGEEAGAIAASLGAGTTGARSENQARTDIPDAPVAEAVFSTPRGAAPRVVQGRLSWAAVRVEAVTEAREPDMAGLRQQARERLLEGEVREMISAAISAYEDARDGGMNVAEAARQAGLAVISVAPVSRRGLGQDGQPVAALAERRDLLAAAFEIGEGEANDFEQDDGVVVAVDRIIPSFVRPLEQARADLVREWTARERASRMRALGEQITADVRGGQSLGAVARARRLRLAGASQTVSRESVQSLPQGLAGQIFGAAEGGVAIEVTADGQAMLVAVVEDIQRIDPATRPQELEAGRASQLQSLQASLTDAVQSEIVARANVNRRQERLARYYPDPSAAAEQAEQ